MRRREFITLLGGAAAWPLVARAQQTRKVARIGYLSIRSPISADDAFFQGLHELGWIEGQNMIIDRRFSAGNVDRLKDFAAELVQLNVDLVAAVASQATHAIKDATASIPVVFVNAGDPVGQGFVKSLAHPGGNITGISFDATPDITAKQVQLLIEAVPRTWRFFGILPVLSFVLIGMWRRPARPRYASASNPWNFNTWINWRALSKR